MKKSILIADAGSTKTQWVLLRSDGENVSCQTSGFNPNYDTPFVLIDALKQLPECFRIEACSLYYYGTGCGTEHNCLIIREMLAEYFAETRICVTNDIMAAAHAVLGHERGVACILGTGSNACLFDGEKIIRNAVSLGYILGDEGSGSSIGRRLLRDYFYGVMPKDISELFDNQYNVTREELIRKLYKEDAPSAFMASFAKFAKQNIGNAYIHKLCCDAFNEFIDIHVIPMLGDDIYQVGFVGSIAFHFSDVLLQCAVGKGLKVSKIMKSPINGLVEYYKEMW